MRPVVAVIDADTTTRHMLRALLSVLDVRVELYDSAESFLADSDAAPACVVIDARLPGMSGLQLLRQLRSGGDVPVILLASEPDVPIAVEAMRHGATDFIEKSRMDVALLRRVSQIVRDHDASPLGAPA